MSSKSGKHGSIVRKRSDVADLLRLWVWYQVVKNVKNSSDDALDLILRPEKNPLTPARQRDRPKLMYRIKRYGFRPRSQKGSHRPDEFAWIISAADGYAHTIDTWNSDLWPLISVTGLTHEENQALISRIAIRNGLTRFTDQEAHVTNILEQHTNWSEFAASGVTPAYVQFIESIVQRAQLDDVIFLLALFREATHLQYFSNAIYLREASARALLTYMHSNYFNRRLAQLMVETIALRVISRACVTPERIELPKDWSPFTGHIEESGFHPDTQLQSLFRMFRYSSEATRPWLQVTNELSQFRKSLSKASTKRSIQREARQLKQSVDRFEKSALVRHASHVIGNYKLVDLFDIELWPT